MVPAAGEAVTRLALCLVFLLALVASVWDWWPPPIQNGPKSMPEATSGATRASKDEEDTIPYLRPVATTVVSDRGGNHVAVGVPDLGELVVGSDNAGAGAGSAEPATQTAVATWVHRDLHGGKTASQTRYYYWDPYYIASNDYPLGTVLVVSEVFTGVVVDRGLMGPNHLDLSEAGFQRLASLDRGVVEVTVREAQTP